MQFAPHWATATLSQLSLSFCGVFCFEIANLSMRSSEREASLPILGCAASGSARCSAATRSSSKGAHRAKRAVEWAHFDDVGPWISKDQPEATSRHRQAKCRRCSHLLRGKKETLRNRALRCSAASKKDSAEHLAQKNAIALSQSMDGRIGKAQLHSSEPDETLRQ